MKAAAIVDNTVLSNFAQVEQARWIAEAFEQPVTVAAVMEELKIGVEQRRIPDVDWSWLEVVDLTPAERAVADELNRRLGRGEAECLAVAAKRGGLIVTDDRDARRTAQLLGVPVSGTLGVLMNVVHRQGISVRDADEILSLMKRRGYRCPIGSLTELLEE